MEGSADLIVTKASNQTTLGVGNSFLYLLKVTNSGPDLNFKVKLTDVLPTQILTDVNFIQVGSNNPDKKDIVCSVAASILTCELGAMIPGEEISINLPASLETFPPDGILHNEAAVTGTELDPNLANTQSTLDLVVTGSGNVDSGGGCSLAIAAVHSGFSSGTWLGLLLVGSLGLRLRKTLKKTIEP